MFLASVVSRIRSVKALFTVLHWFMFMLVVLLIRASIWARASVDARRSLWERWMLSLENLAHDLGMETLQKSVDKTELITGIWSLQGY